MISKRMQALLGLATLSLASAPVAGGDWDASATLHNQNGEIVGEVLVRDTPHGALLHARLLDIASGPHAFHIHETGECTPPFKSAGGHYNPNGTDHGLADGDGHHAGDMPNVHVPASGKTKLEIFNPAVTADELVNADDGTAIVMHAGPDDYSTDPAGAAGGRIACGVIQAD